MGNHLWKDQWRNDKQTTSECSREDWHYRIEAPPDDPKSDVATWVVDQTNVSRSLPMPGIVFLCPVALPLTMRSHAPSSPLEESLHQIWPIHAVEDCLSVCGLIPSSHDVFVVLFPALWIAILSPVWNKKDEEWSLTRSNLHALRCQPCLLLWYTDWVVRGVFYVRELFLLLCRTTYHLSRGYVSGNRSISGNRSRSKYLHSLCWQPWPSSFGWYGAVADLHSPGGIDSPQVDERHRHDPHVPPRRLAYDHFHSSFVENVIPTPLLSPSWRRQVMTARHSVMEI